MIIGYIHNVSHGQIGRSGTHRWKMDGGEVTPWSLLFDFLYLILYTSAAWVDGQLYGRFIHGWQPDQEGTAI